MREQKERQYLELGDASSWPGSAGRTRVLFVALNVPGYYSLPIRILSLIVEESPALSARYDARFVEWSPDDDDRMAANKPANVERTTTALSPFVDRVAEWKPDIVGISVNIWTRGLVFRMSAMLKERLPGLCVIAGGQEVSGSVTDYLATTPSLDYIVDGEGEIPLKQFLEQWDAASRRLRDPDAVSGLWLRESAGSRLTKPAELLASLDELPSVILAGLVPVRGKGKLGILLEGTRGCPFRCSFCFEGGRGCKVRTTSVERLESEVTYMSERGARFFHMMDPILCNSRPERLAAIRDVFAGVSRRHPNTMTSVEAYADQVSEEVAACLGAFTMVDVGLQTINPETVKAIHRVYDPAKFLAGFQRLSGASTTVNVYLISGLPYETFATFLKGVEYVLSLNPTRMFLNELCLLNGTELRRRADEYGYVFDPEPPYHVLSSKWIGAGEMTLIHCLSTPFAMRYNLSARSIAHMMPWASSSPPKIQPPLRAVLGGPCSVGCPGCRLRGEAGAPSAVGDLARTAADRDVELVAGDGHPEEAILRAATQLNFHGASRVRLVAPMSRFGNGVDSGALVNAGVWHFHLCADLRRVAPADAASSAKWKTTVGSIARSMRLPRWGEVRPYVEVTALTGGSASPWWGMIAAAASAAGTVSLPGVRTAAAASFLVDGSVPWQEAFRWKCWPRLPSAAMSLLLEGSPSADETLKSLDRLGLLCNEGEQMPCFVPEHDV